MPSETVTIEGHVIDSFTLPKVLEEIVELGGTYEILDLEVGARHENPSFARVNVAADSDEELAALIERLGHLGANQETSSDVTLVPADVEGAFPPGFYSTTNLETEVRIGGRWVRVEHPEMDCGIVVEGNRARTIAMADIEMGMPIVMAGGGMRVTPPQKPRDRNARQVFEFMSSEVSSEKPKGLLVDHVAEQMAAVKAAGKRILWVVGPALVHTGCGPDLSALIRAGYVNALFAGNGVAAHDVESNMFGTSLGVYLDHGVPAEHGHEHHIRALNEIRRHGSFRAAIDAGVFSDGIVYHLVTCGADYLFGGSVRDDGPMPETEPDMLRVQARLRDLIWGRNGDDLVGYCLIAGTMLHGIATGNCLPASVPLACIDINQATVTKLLDRGSFQSLGIITDVGLFLNGLARRLCPEELAGRDAAQA
jgi:lysine-ketoglutarate reductase/saccharopine dehydrogenase-like protein (TIGR00300 family)